MMINTSPEPVTNWTASIAEDLAVIGGLWTALNYPIAFIVLVVIFILLMIWFLPKLWRAIKTLFSKIANFFSGKKEESSLGSITIPDKIKSIDHDKSD